MCITIPIILVIVKGELGSDRDALEILKYLTATPPGPTCHWPCKKRPATIWHEKGVKGTFPRRLFHASKKEKTRQLPTFPHNRSCSIIGVTGLNYRVRDGNGCGPCAMVTGKLELQL